MAGRTPIRTTGLGLLMSLVMILALRCILWRNFVYALGHGKVAGIVSKVPMRISREESVKLAQYTAVVAPGDTHVTGKHYCVGDDVIVQCPDKKQWFPGKVKAIKHENLFVVEWNDLEGSRESELTQMRMKMPRIPVKALQVGTGYVGVVRKVYDNGAYVDIGAEDYGFVHMSKISRQQVSNVRDYLQENQILTVWVCHLRKDGKFGLSMMEGQHTRSRMEYLSFEKLPPDTWLDGTVEKIETYGLWVCAVAPDGVEGKGVVGKEYITNDFVEDVFAEVRVEQHVKVRVIECDLDRGWLKFAMNQHGMTVEVPADLQRFKQLIPEKWIKGKVVAHASYGAFVRALLPDGTAFDGLLHTTQIDDKLPEHALEVDEDIQVRVIHVDTVLGMMSLSTLPVPPREASQLGRGRTGWFKDLRGSRGVLRHLDSRE